MNRLAYPKYKISSYALVATVYALYVAVFAIFHVRTGDGIASLALIPVIGGSWYFGIRGGVLAAIFSTLANIILRTFSGHTYIESFTNPSMVVGTFALVFVALIVGRLATVTRERSEALKKLEALEKIRQTHTKFLELLNEITGTILEADNLGSTLKVLVEHIAKLFEADDCFFAFWNESNKTATPMAAYGSMSETYPFMRFDPGEKTLAASLMEAGHPLAIPDMENSPYLSSKIASLFPSRSMLGLPLIVQDKRLATLYLGYNKRRDFEQNEVSRAAIVAQQIAMILTKTQLLEDARKQVRQLTVLHEVSLVTTQVETEDQLIERITDIIGLNLFPDNFGVLLLDDKSEILNPHPSYRFFSFDESLMVKVRLGEGVTGQVAETGQPQRIGDVHSVRNYLGVDKRTASELCVPIKFKERVLGVINAESTKKNVFTVDDERLLATLAGQLAIAIEQLRTARAERQWLDQLAHSNNLIYSLAHITTHVEKALSVDEIIRTLGEELQKINLTCLMAVHETEHRLFSINYTSIKPEDLRQFEAGIGISIINYTFSLGDLPSTLDGNDFTQPLVIPSPEDELQVLFPRSRKTSLAKILPEAGFGSEVELLRLPLMFEENLFGILWVWGNAITKTDLPIMSIFAKQVGISLERARLFEEVQSLAFTDPLTGLNNRRSLFEFGRIEFSRAHRMKRPFCCMMLDIDYFKQVNDRYGHQVGDQVLQEFANRCKNSVREVDLVGRYGGEEVIIILPETDLITALPVAERLRKSIAESPMKVSNREITVTVSIGVAQKDEYTIHLETLVARADQAMYIAKHKGRNQVATSK